VLLAGIVAQGILTYRIARQMELDVGTGLEWRQRFSCRRAQLDNHYAFGFGSQVGYF
jgi:hypothetical protein